MTPRVSIAAVTLFALSTGSLVTHAQETSRVTVFRNGTEGYNAYRIPTIVTAAVIAFLQSFENDRTPLFSIGGSHTLVAEIGARMRFGIIHMVKAIGILFIAVTIICAVIWSLLRQRERRRKAAA